MERESLKQQNLGAGREPGNLSADGKYRLCKAVLRKASQLPMTELELDPRCQTHNPVLTQRHSHSLIFLEICKSCSAIQGLDLPFGTVQLKVRSANQQHQLYLRACQKPRTSCPVPDLPNQSLHVSMRLRGFVCWQSFRCSASGHWSATLAALWTHLGQI